MKRSFSLLSASLLALATVSPAATVTVSNYNADGNGFHGIAGKNGTLLAPGAGNGVIGRLPSLTDTDIANHVASGNIAALHAAFRTFDAAFALELTNTGPDGALQKVLNATTVPAADTNSFGGNPIYVWFYTGNDRATATDYFLVKLSQNFPLDPVDLPPLWAEVLIRPGNIARTFAGRIGPETHDYGQGSGPLERLVMRSTEAANTAPVAQNASFDVVEGVEFSGDLEASDTDLDDLSFIKVSDPNKGTLSLASDGSFSYTATPGQSGQDSFTFKVNDGFVDSNTATVTLTIQATNQPQTLSFPAPPQRFTWDEPFDLVATASSDLPVSFQILSGPATLSGKTVTLTGSPGVVHVRAWQPGNLFYAPSASVDQHFHVVPVSARFALTNLSQTYTGGPLTVGFTGSPAQAVIITYNGSPNPPVNAGTYSVIATAGTLRATGRFIIQKAPLTLTADDQRKFIGQPNPPLTFTYSGFLGSDTEASVFPAPPAPPARPVAVRPTISTTAKDTSPGGVYPITFKGGLTQNYRLVFVPGDLVIDSFAGRYESLLVSPVTQRPIAKVELTVAPTLRNNKMAYTGRLLVPTDLTALSLKGEFTIDPLTETASADWALTRTVSSVTTQYLLSLDLDINGGLESVLDINAALYAQATNGSRLFVPAKGVSVPSAGPLTAVFGPGTHATTSTNPIPLGSGHAKGSIDSKAVLKWTLTLADGTVTTTSLNPGEDGAYRLFVTPYRRLNSYAAAQFELEPHPTLIGRQHLPSTSNRKLTWTKAPGATDRAYRSGIDLLDCVITLDPWRAPARASRTLPAITLLPELGLTTSTVITVEHSGFPGVDGALLPTEVLMDASGKITVQTPPENAASWQITIKPTDGSFTGRFTLRNEVPRTVNFTGVLRRSLNTTPNEVLGRGHFLLPPLPSEGTTELRSGDIKLYVD